MTDSTSLLYGTAASIALLHTLLGPDHYLPFIAMSRAGKWSLTKTLIVTALCGIGHVLSSVFIGVIGIVFGVAVLRLESVESFRVELSGFLMIGFGLIYLVWGLRHAMRNRPHTHWHTHADGTVHAHEHTHTKEHLHVHAMETSKRQNVETSKRQNIELSKHQYVEMSKHQNVELSKCRENRVPLAACPPVIRAATVRERETTSFPPCQGETEGGKYESDPEMPSINPRRVDNETSKHRVPLVPMYRDPPVHRSNNEKVETSTLTPWILFTIFLFGPCELLIPVLMYPAARADVWCVVGVTAVFGITTIATMTLIVAVAHLMFSIITVPRTTDPLISELSRCTSGSGSGIVPIISEPRPSGSGIVTESESGSEVGFGSESSGGWMQAKGRSSRFNPDSKVYLCIRRLNHFVTQRLARSPLFQRLSQYSHALAGLVITLCGTAMLMGM